jgi:hypothetical protein
MWLRLLVPTAIDDMPTYGTCCMLLYAASIVLLLLLQVVVIQLAPAFHEDNN